MEECKAYKVKTSSNKNAFFLQPTQMDKHAHFAPQVMQHSPTSHHHVLPQAAPIDFIRHITLVIAVASVLLVVLWVLLYNYLLLAPHLTVFFWSVFVTFLLRKVKRPILNSLVWMHRKIPFSYRYTVYAILWAIAMGCCYQFIIVPWKLIPLQQRFALILLFGGIVIVLLVPIILQMNTLATILTILLLGLSGTIFMLLITQVCYHESIAISNMVSEFVEQNKELIMQTFRNTSRTGANSTALEPFAYQHHARSIDVWTRIEAHCNTTLSIAIGPIEFVKQLVTANSSYAKLHEMQKYICFEQLHYVKENLGNIAMNAASWFGMNIGLFGSGLTNFFRTSIDVLANLSDFVFESVLFVTLVYYFLEV